MRNFYGIAASVVMLASCTDETLSTHTQHLDAVDNSDLGPHAMQLTWSKASHNTYEAANTPLPLITSHLTDTDTYHIELDLRDFWQSQTYPPTSLYYDADWSVQHDPFGAPTAKCGGSGKFSDCLGTLKSWHEDHPNHPLVTVWLDKKTDWEDDRSTADSRSPWQLDNLISQHFGPSALFRPIDRVIDGRSLRSSVMSSGWPQYQDLSGKFMFILNTDADSNTRMSYYAASLGGNANVFIAAAAKSAIQITGTPPGMTSATRLWLAIYNFAWTDASGGAQPYLDGECDSDDCRYMCTAHANNFLTRAYDIDDPIEADMASGGDRLSNAKGWANFIAMDHPEEADYYPTPGPDGDSGYGFHPYGFYTPTTCVQR